ncbi:hypothetical protein K450DRAFT_271776 [Umbelopsis ramanniana AG]|uniref:NmrA-like domain-containing protein n=1 Tax=Umbelopsis ramanniana AG TaxID=1314678 RepID=A0AAD5EB49_UMBRA|nr:uncharacterized protein K450DRAFT_271776 [Umbelopsis ramanniana AG]KAI8579701.1 hypothetical protein K450DRAFT_271776 [Umbelopsis ramanniana AG]
MSQKTILITAANGTVGSSLAALLLDQGFNVHALVRNTESTMAHDLKKRGAKIFKGDFSDISSLQIASQGIWGVFINGFPVHGTMDELTHNQNVIKVAKEAGAKFGVYMSVMMAGRKDDIPGMNPQRNSYNYWESKSGSEKALREAGFDYWTILRPSTFISNFFGRFAAYIYPTLQKQHLISSPFEPSFEQSFIDPEDISKFAAAAFANPDTFNGEAIELSSEQITLKDVGVLITDIVGIPIAVEHIPREEYIARGLPDQTAEWYDWAKALDFHIDYERMEQFPVKRNTVADYLKRNKGYITDFLSQ